MKGAFSQKKKKNTHTHTHSKTQLDENLAFS